MFSRMFEPEREVWRERVKDLHTQVQSLQEMVRELQKALILPQSEPMLQSELLKAQFPDEIQAAIDARASHGLEDAELRHHLETYARTQIILDTPTEDIKAAILAGTDLSEI